MIQFFSWYNDNWSVGVVILLSVILVWNLPKIFYYAGKYWSRGVHEEKKKFVDEMISSELKKTKKEKCDA